MSEGINGALSDACRGRQQMQLAHLLKDDTGATAVEYAVVAFAITLGIVLAVNWFGLH